MTGETKTGLCSDEEMGEALGALQQDDEGGIAKIDSLLEDHPQDARLHFLKGSVLAGMQRYAEAHQGIARAVAIAPGFAIARFQLGFLEFTSGEAASAEATWAPLMELAHDDPLRLFASGLQLLARDEFAEAIALLRQGVANNQVNPVLNRDMEMLIREIQTRTGEEAADEPMSLAELALRQSAARNTRH